MEIAKLTALILLSIVLIVPGCGPGPDALSRSNSEANDEKPVQPASRVKAKAGVGKRGQKLKKHDGIYSTPLKALLNTQQKLAFMNAERALQLFQAGKGRFPNSHEEYMQEIIEANQIVLPELPEGESYEYDPETHELMVLRPGG